MRSLLAFWIGGASSTVFVPPEPLRNIFRLDQAGTGGDLYGGAGPGGQTGLFRGSAGGQSDLFRSSGGGNTGLFRGSTGGSGKVFRT
jgi:hypothetical protein